MKRVVALAAVVLAATVSTASAGAYLGLGVGTAPATSESSDQITTEPDGRSGRLLLGYRFGRIAVEGSAGRYDLVLNHNPNIFSSTQLGLGGKYSFPLGDKFEAFGRGGIQRTSLSRGMEGDGYAASGTGWYLGAGFEYRLNLVVAAGSIFVDYQFAKTSLENAAMSYDTSNRMWTLGVTVSL